MMLIQYLLPNASTLAQVVCSFAYTLSHHLCLYFAVNQCDLLVREDKPLGDSKILHTDCFNNYLLIVKVGPSYFLSPDENIHLVLFI